MGGLEQCFLDYQRCLEINNIDTIAITSYGAEINNCIESYKLINLGVWDILSIYKLKTILNEFKPEIIIAHGDRAIKFALKAGKNTKIIGVAHNYKNKMIKHCDYIFVTTLHLKNYFSSYGYGKNIFLFPNMTSIKKEYLAPMFRNPIVIGTYGRFVKKKGFHIFLEAIKILRASGLNIKGIVGGSGEEDQNLKKLCSELYLNSHVNFVGWISNRDKFFQDIDIFCMPSLHEPFGISLIEAMSYSKPVVSSMSEGPSEIIKHNQNGLLATINDAQDLAQKLQILIKNEILAKKLSYSAYLTVKNSYNIEINAHLLNQHLMRIMSNV